MEFIADTSPLIQLVGDMLDPNGKSEYCLKAHRRRKGKPQDRIRKLMVETDICMDLQRGLDRGIKRESAVADVCANYRLSRSQVFKILRKGGIARKSRQIGE
jgi:hypothetical protein